MCEELSDVAGRTVGFRGEDDQEPSSLLSRAERMLVDATGKLSGFMLRGLQRRITQLRVIRVVLDHFKTDLAEHMYECRELLKRQEGETDMPMAVNS